MIKLSILTAVLLSISVLLNSTPVQSQSLKVSPLKYEEQLELGAEKTGYVDVSNPGDSDITVSTQVRAFRQINTDGDLEFYDDEQIEAGINIDVDQFDLGPREAARIFFEIDSNQLPEGGVYAALLFEADGQAGDDTELESSTIATATRVGTLLLLENGDDGVKEGEISRLDIPFWQFGGAITGSLEFTAFDGEKALAFEPELSSSIPLAGEEELESGLVFAGNSREFALERGGNHIGIFPVTVTDAVTGASASQWALVVTGVWQIILPFFLLAVVASIFLQRYFKKH